MEVTAVKSIETIQTNMTAKSQIADRSYESISQNKTANAQKPGFQQNETNNQSSFSSDDQKDKLIESTKKFNQMSESLNLDIKFAYNDKIDQVYLNVIDKNSGKIIRKLPSEEAMKISESMKDLVGALLDKKG